MICLSVSSVGLTKLCQIMLVGRQIPYSSAVLIETEFVGFNSSAK